MTFCFGKARPSSRSKGATAPSIVDGEMRLIRIRVTAVFVAAALAGLLPGCATTHGPISASGKPIPKATLEAAQQRVEQEQIPPNLKPYYLAMYAEGRENVALYAMRGGLEAL